MSSLLAGVGALCRACLRCGAFTMLALLVGMPSATMAQADDLRACVNRKVKFDGIVPLQYAKVKVGSGPRLYLDPGYSDHCSMGMPASCGGTPYLVAGDAVAVGKMCMARDYVQYIGKTRISEGWVDSTALSPIAPPPPPKPPVVKIGKEVLPPSAPRHYRFTLTKGTGVPVCEAYQQRLNQTEFYKPPYCGRPESTIVPGFDELHRRYLTGAQFGTLYYPAMAVLEHGPLQDFEKRQTNPDGSVTFIPKIWDYSNFTPGAWTYDPPVDITNSGQDSNVIMWTMSDRYNWRCGNATNPDGSFERVGASGLVMSADEKNINRDATYAVFGGSDLPIYLRGIFPEVADEFGIFRYRNLNYFDAMFTPALFDKRKRNTLAVFLYAHHQRQEICEYHVSGIGDHP